MRYLLILSAALLSAQAQAKPRPKVGFEATLPAPAAASRIADGSIFDPDGGYAPLHAGHRAHRVGDPVTIVLIEAITATKSAGSKTQRGGTAAIAPPATGLLSFLKPSSLNASSNSSFKGDGTATQASTLGGEVAVTIAEVRPGGTALVRGEKRLLLSQGHDWIQFSGIVRLSDIDSDNRLISSRVADARIEYAGNGAVSRASKEGWLSRFFNMISPF